MNAVTLQMPDEVHEQIQMLAKEKGVSVDEFLAEVTSQIAEDWQAERRFRIRAARGAGRESEALALLDRE